jgi:hypothetical protein
MQSRVAWLQMNAVVVGREPFVFMLMSTEPVMVLWMVVIRVGVNVQRRKLAQRPHQGQDPPEDDCGEAAHSGECM